MNPLPLKYEKSNTKMKTMGRMNGDYLFYFI